MNKEKHAKQLFLSELRKNKALEGRGPHELVIILDHLKSDFNVGKIFRSAEIMGVHEIHLVGLKEFDPTPARGTFRKVKCHFHEKFESCYEELKVRGYIFMAFDAKGEEFLHLCEFPLKTAMIFGHEEFGIMFDIDSFPGVTRVKIKQYGQTESFNVSVAAAVAMYEFNRRYYP